MDKQTLLSILSPEIKQVEAVMQAEFSAIRSSLLAEVVHHAIFNGGKRIRPILTLLSARLITFTTMPDGIAQEGELTPPEDLYRLATVFEYLHGASLLHDDVIDHADTRRGAITTHRKWNNESAILAGDFLHTSAMTMAGTIGGSETIAVIGSATAAMIDAEFLQAQASAGQDLQEETYFQILRGKTGALIGAACEAGAIFVEASSEHRQAIRRYGDALGVAFQMIDDLLDYQGDSAKTGKAVGNDFSEGKMTLPLIHAMTEGSNEDGQRLQQLLDLPASERENHIDEARRLIERGHGFTYTREGAETLIAAALEALAIFPACQTRELLSAIAHYVLNREK